MSITLSSKHRAYNAPVLIFSEGESIIALQTYNKPFIKIMKAERFFWHKRHKRWEKRLYHYNGKHEPHIAEIALILIQAGFSVCVEKEEIANMVKTGDFELPCKRWIIRSSTKNDYIAIKWQEGDYWREARRLPGACWFQGEMIVDKKFFQDIIDFAEIYDFGITEKAQALLNDEKKRFNDSLFVIDEIVKPRERAKKNIIIEDLPSDIDESLRD